MFGRKNVIVELDDRNDIPSYRYYGKRGSIILETVAVWLTTALFSAFFAVYFLIVFLVLKGIYTYLGVLIPTVFTFIITVSLFYFLFRRVIKRPIFTLKLWQVCRKKHYGLDIRRGFFHSLGFASSGYHFVVETSLVRFFVRYLATYRYNTEIIFRSPETVTARTNIDAHKSNLKTAFGIKEKYKTRPFSFSDETDQKDKRAEKVILMNPVPREAYCIKNGTKTPVGSQDKIFGYTLYSGSDFIDELKKADRAVDFKSKR